jgi:ABC-type glycerol-3-phosphate transport system substrate-binding protein
MRKRIGAFVVVLLATLFVLAPQVFASGGGETTSSVKNPYGDPVKIKFFYADGTIPKDDNRTMVWVEKKFNADIQWQGAPWADYANALNTRLAAGDIPDWFSVQAGARSDLFDALIQDGIALDYMKYLDKYPNIKKYVTGDHPEIITLFGEKDGKRLYSVPGFFGYQRHAPFVRKDWFDAVGLKLPDTWDEYKSSLKKIMQVDPGGTKPYGLSVFTQYFFENAIPAYTGSADNWYKKDGKWIYRAFDPGFKTWVSYWEGMYKDGILDPEFSLLKTSDVTSKFASGKIVSSFNHINAVNWNIFADPLKEANPKAEMALILPYPSGPAGRFWVRNDGYFMTDVINAKSDPKVIERVLAIMDWNKTAEGQVISTYGLEGVHYTKSGDKIVRNLEETNKDVGTPGGNQFVMGLGGLPVWREAIEIPAIRANSEALAKFGVTNKMRINIPLAEQDAWKALNTKFSEANNEWYPKFFIGKASVSTDYDKYLDALRNAGYAQMQAYFDKYGSILDLGALKY